MKIKMNFSQKELMKKTNEIFFSNNTVKVKFYLLVVSQPVGFASLRNESKCFLEVLEIGLELSTEIS